jgi:hypothetical protein
LWEIVVPVKEAKMNAEKYTKVKYFTIVALLIPALVLLAGIAFARADEVEETYLLAAPVFIPGGNEEWGTCQPVLAYEFIGTGATSPLTSIPAEAVCDPAWAAFNDQGELFVSNRNWNTEGGSIQRFLYDPAVGFIPHGSITDESIKAPHGIAFSPWGELFVANYLGGISRYVFDAAGNAVPHGVINDASALLGITVSAAGEVFVTQGDTVFRFLVEEDSTEVIPNGTFSVAMGSGLHGLAFNEGGELFIGGIYANKVFRYTFDLEGNPIANGAIEVFGGPIGVAFSPEGELFVGNHFSGGIARFLFDGDGNAIPNGTIETSHMGGLAIYGGTFAPRPRTYLPLVLIEFTFGQLPPDGPQPGEWTGTTSLAYPMSFDVSSDSTQWSMFVVKTNWEGCFTSGTVEETVSGPGAIIEDQFSGTLPTYGFTGEFTSPTTAVGTYFFNNHMIVVGISYPPYVCYVYLTESGSWTASAP